MDRSNDARARQVLVALLPGHAERGEDPALGGLATGTALLDGVNGSGGDSGLLCKLVGASVTGPEIARRMYVEHNILVKDCAGKSMPDADRYLRLASRTPDENRSLVKALAALL